MHHHVTCLRAWRGHSLRVASLEISACRWCAGTPWQLADGCTSLTCGQKHVVVRGRHPLIWKQFESRRHACPEVRQAPRLCPGQQSRACSQLAMQCGDSTMPELPLQAAIRGRLTNDLLQTRSPLELPSHALSSTSSRMCAQHCNAATGCHQDIILQTHPPLQATTVTSRRTGAQPQRRAQH